MWQKDSIKRGMELFLGYQYGKTLENASERELYIAFVRMMMPVISEFWKEKKQVVYYISMEWAPEHMLKRVIFSMDMQEEILELLEEVGLTLGAIHMIEQEAECGFGEEGRFASAMLETLTQDSDKLVCGCGIRYQYGETHPTIAEGGKHSQIIYWLRDGNPYEVCKDDECIEIQIGGVPVLAVPYDMPVVGQNLQTVSTLRVWGARAKRVYGHAEYDALPRSEWPMMMAEEMLPKTVTDVFFPWERMYEGKKQCLRQQYFLVSASVRYAVNQHMKKHHDIHSFHKMNQLYLQDERTVLAVPELMRILLDEYGLEWGEAWYITARACMAVEMGVETKRTKEIWPVERGMIDVLPRIVGILKEMQQCITEGLWEVKGDIIAVEEGEEKVYVENLFNYINL